VPDKLLLPDARYARGRMLGSRIASGLHAAMIGRDADRLRSADDAATILDGDVVGIVWICRGHKKSSLQERRAYLALQQRKDIRLAHHGGGELPGTPTRPSARPRWGRSPYPCQANQHHLLAAERQRNAIRFALLPDDKSSLHHRR